MSERTPDLLRIEGLAAAYQGTVVALHQVTLSVPEGAVVALLGSNGAGKTTTLQAVAGLLPAQRGAVTAGTIYLDGRPVTFGEPGRMAARGVALVPEGRRCFRHLTVEENLVAGALARRPSRAVLERDLEESYARFPKLVARRKIAAGHLSGGEQQLLALGRALMGKPRLVLLDEPSMGLAPQVVEQIFQLVKELNAKSGVSFLVAEQNARIALRHAHQAYVLENGRIAASGPAAELAGQADVQALYLGSAGGVRIRFRARSKAGLPTSLRSRSHP